jgi:protein-S-isoprenylcysteine O-methyltransferase Ste14
MEKKRWAQNLAAYSSIVMFFVMALEVMIMISPFAFFFYAVFSPVFNFLGQHAATRWLTAFFLPHMILPPTMFLKTVRLAGSVFFVLGALTFLVCAAQVYLGKILHWGIAAKGLYRYVRHPQYLSLSIWGLGMAILWPRFIVLASLSFMLTLYYFLARDEERRMVKQYGASYENYLKNTGRFFPRAMEEPLSVALSRILPRGVARGMALPVLMAALVLGAGFLLREITLRSLPLASRGNLTVVAILPEDGKLAEAALKGVLALETSGQESFLTKEGEFLAYLMPVDYVMQGMIADTGEHSHLFKQHHTVALILDWVLHPFAHLRRPPSAHMAAMHQVDPEVARRHHCPLGLDHPEMTCDSCVYRRLIVVEIGPTPGPRASGPALLSLGLSRTPVGFVDLDTTSGQALKVSRVKDKTAWRDVPTPEI